MQTSNQYSSILDCVRKTGLTGLYRGIMSPLVGVTPMFALSFWSYDMGQKLVYTATPSRTSSKLSLWEYAFAGAFSAFPTTIITTPMERVKVVMQTQGQDGKGGVRYNGMFDAGRAMYAEGGLGSLYRGTVATLARDIPGFSCLRLPVSGSAAYFVSYEATARALRPSDGSLSIGAELFAGGMAGVAMWSIAIPPDVIKSRMQASPAGTYKGTLDCAAKVVRGEGVSALFKGLGPALLRAFPANAAAFLGRAATLSLLHQMW